MFTVYLQQSETCYLNGFSGRGFGLMQRACSHGLEDFVRAMLEHDMDPEAVVEECQSKPVLLAAYYGYAGILRV